MVHQFTKTGLLVACFIFLIYLLPAGGAEKGLQSVSSSSGESRYLLQFAKSVQSQAAPQLNAAIERIFVKGNRLFVVLGRSGSGKIAPEDYARIKLRLETSKGSRLWSLAEVDKVRVLGSGAGRMEFDTGIILGKTETVNGVLSLGDIKKPFTARVAGNAATPVDELPPISRSSSPTSIAPAAGPVTSVTSLPAFITIHRPRAGLANTPGGTMQVDYQLSRRIAEGPIGFALYRAGTEPQTQSSPSVQRRDSPLLQFTVNYRPGAAGTPEPIHMISRTLPRDLEPGRYCLIARHAEATGRSSYFDVTFEMGGEEIVYCDYGIDTATYRDGRSLGSYALEVSSTSSMVQGYFRVRIHWNGAHAPAGYPPAGTLPYALSVRSANTGAQIGRSNFGYRADTNFNIDVYFEFAKDDIPGMTIGGVIPLEFRLEKTSSESIDGNPDNNLLAAQIAVNTVENNMEIRLRDFALTRTPHLRPRKDEYHLSQGYKLRNLSGRTTNVKIKGCVYRRDADETWDSASGLGCSTLTDQPIGADWTNKTFSLTFREQDPRDIPYNSRFRVIIEVDPDHALIDSDRINNKGIYTFRITEGAPGAGSGTVTGD